MDLHMVNYSIYLLLSTALTVWVGRTLYRSGRIFLIEAFEREEVADSVNHLLVVGFYLVNLGLVALLINWTFRDLLTAGDILLEVTTKVGLVLLLLGLMHFTNLGVISRMRRSRRDWARYQQHYYAQQAARPE